MKQTSLAEFISRGAAADRAVDGNNSPVFGQSSCSHTKENGDLIPWLAVDLQQQYLIQKVRLPIEIHSVCQ